jgi:hypothetical protein
MENENFVDQHAISSWRSSSCNRVVVRGVEAAVRTVAASTASTGTTSASAAFNTNLTLSSGPIVLKITGSKISPCVIPNKTKAKNAIKTVLKISDVEKASGNVPRTVVRFVCLSMLFSSQ